MTTNITDIADGHDVWSWPEFIAFAERLGIDLRKETLTRNVVIFIPFDGIVTITQEYIGKNIQEDQP